MGYNSEEEMDEAEKCLEEITRKRLNDEERTRIFNESTKKPYVEKEPVKIRSVKCCRMIPLEPDCRGCTDVFICTNCHQHIHLGFIRKEYSGSFCLECGAEVKDGERE